MIRNGHLRRPGTRPLRVTFATKSAAASGLERPRTYRRMTARQHQVDRRKDSNRRSSMNGVGTFHVAGSPEMRKGSEQGPDLEDHRGGPNGFFIQAEGPR